MSNVGLYKVSNTIYAQKNKKLSLHLGNCFSIQTKREVNSRSFYSNYGYTFTSMSLANYFVSSLLIYKLLTYLIEMTTFSMLPLTIIITGDQSFYG